MVDSNELMEGTSLGGYILERRIGDDGAAALFAVITPDGERRLLKALPEEDPDSARQYELWERSRHLRHPNLLALERVERSNGYLCAVFEHPDDALASALEQGPLSEEETRGVLEASLAALRYLHAQGMVHGEVDAGHIVAVGETVKLTTDALRESEDVEACAEDVRQLGDLLRSLRAPEPLREPLATIASRATAEDRRQRWTLAEIAKALEPRAAEPAPPSDVPPSRPVVVPAPAAPPVVVPAEPVVPAAGVEHNRRGIPKWIFLGAAVLVVFILLLNTRHKPEPPAPGAAAIPLTPPPAAESAAPPSEAPPPAAARPAETAAPESGNWRVIAFTFRSQKAASEKARRVNQRWPSLHATVFAPRELRGYYLVALGGRTSRQEAALLQRKARKMGLPRDTFIQNYRE